LAVQGVLRTNGFISIDANPQGTPSYKNDTWLGVTGPDNAYTTIEAVGYSGDQGTYPGIQLVTFGCIKANICAVPNNRVIGTYSFNAYNNQGDNTDSALLSRTTEDQTPTHNGADLEGWYTPNGSTAFTLGFALSFNGNGGVTIGNPSGGDISPGSLNVQGPYYSNGIKGVSCGGVNPATMEVVNGIVVHC